MDPRASRSPDKSRHQAITHPPPAVFEHPPPHAVAATQPLVTVPIGEFDDEMYKRRYLTIKPIVHELEDENNLIAYKIKVLIPRIQLLEEELKAKRDAIEKKKSKLWKAPHPDVLGGAADARGGIKMDPGEWAALERSQVDPGAHTHGYYSSDDEFIGVPAPGGGKAAKNGFGNGDGEAKAGRRKSSGAAHAPPMNVDVDMDSARDSGEGTRRSNEVEEDEEIDDY